MAVQLITKTAYARLRGCDEKAVRKAVAEKRISLIDGKIDPGVADIQWAQNTRARVAQNAAPGGAGQAAIDASGERAGNDEGSATQNGNPPTDPGYMHYRVSSEKSDSEMKAMAAGKMAGTLTERDRVDMAFFVTLRSARDHLTSCARRIAAEVSSLNTAEACESVIDREHRIVLELIMTTMKEHLGSPPADRTAS